MKGEKFFRILIIVIKVLIPVTYFTITATEGKTYWMGGVMFVLVLGWYGLEAFGFIKKSK